MVQYLDMVSNICVFIYAHTRLLLLKIVVR